MEGFIGREAELSELESRYNGNSFEFVAIYGRRRVGKTSLIQQFSEGKRAIFFTANISSMEIQLRSLNKLCDKVLGRVDSFSEFDEFLVLMADAAKDERLILVIDEFPYLVESDPSVMGTLQKHIDHYLKNTHLFLILCGSSMSFMENQVLGGKSPLYGRRTLQMKIKPMDYFESSRFFPRRTPLEKAEIYGVTGGIPSYLSMFEREGTVEDLIFYNYYRNNALLASEPSNLIMQEMRDPYKYNMILEALASGHYRITDIAVNTRLDPSEVTRSLKDLISLEIVNRSVPVDEKENSRKARYVISDNIFRFYYSYVFDDGGLMNGMDVNEARTAISKIMNDYMGSVFEEICGEYVTRILGYPHIGRWWGPDPKTKVMEGIDIVAKRRMPNRGIEALFAECKMRNELADVDVLIKLKGRADLVKGFDSRSFVIFSRSGFTDRLKSRAELEGVRLVTLEDMYRTNV